MQHGLTHLKTISNHLRANPDPGKGVRAMALETDWALSKNQTIDLAKELDVEGEARLYRAFRHFWHPVIYSHELRDEPKPVTLCGEKLVVVRLNDAVHAFNDLCAHRGTALSLGAVVDGENGQELRCAYHGWQYDEGGICSFAPQRMDLAGQLRARVKRYHTAEAYGMVWVCLEEEPHFELPKFPQYDDPSYNCLPVPATSLL